MTGKIFRRLLDLQCPLPEIMSDSAGDSCYSRGAVVLLFCPPDLTSAPDQ